LQQVFLLEKQMRNHLETQLGCPMTHPTKMLPLTLVATIVLQLPLVSIASAQQTSPGVVAKQTRARTLYQSMDMMPNGGFWSQSAARAAHPITQGGTTGGTVNPGLTGDHMQHGYNGG
jgi:hypothetical protein